MSCNLKPTEDRVVIRPLETSDTTPGGIVLPDNAKEKPQRGEVVAIGPGKRNYHADGMGWSTSEPAVFAGDRVLYGRYSGVEVEQDGETFVIMRETDVLAVIAQPSEQSP
jgi:chaperonin GroES